LNLKCDVLVSKFAFRWGYSGNRYMLAAEAAHLEDRLKQVEGEREAALAGAVGGLEHELEAGLGHFPLTL
jgi:hypothetical protein